MSSPSKTVFFENFTFHVSKNVYEPAEDTYLLAESLVVNQDDVVLDVGTGCGILGVLAAKKAKKVVAVDINPHAIRCTQMNAERNGVADKMDTRLGNLFEPVMDDEKFNMIIFNSPYLPSKKSEQKAWIDRAWAGGSSGREIINQFISQAPQYMVEKGRILMVQSTLSNVRETVRKLEEEGLVATVVAEKKVAFETIVVIRGEYRHSNTR